MSSKAFAQARAIKHSQADSGSNKPPNTRQFANAYKAFFDVPEINDDAMAQVRVLKNGGQVHSRRHTNGAEFRISTGVKEDPNFKANAARFHGTEASKEDEMYKNYRAFYGGATPNVN